jgi:nucleoside-diphosphate-sugar epimerase
MASIVDKVSSAISGNTGSGKTVLVTGASGFVASHVVEEFLEQGYNVIGTVRSESTGNRVKETFSKYGDKISFRIVEDVASEGAHDEAVKGVDGVIHTASPFFTSGVKDNESELLRPAIHGTKGVLESIKKNNPNVKRVVITSSFASILNMEKGTWPEHTYTEEDWNPVTYEAAKTGNGGVAYCASKTFAEKAAFDFVKDQKPNFDISTICPPMIYGPNTNKPDLNKLNTSSQDIYRFMNGSTTEIPETTFPAFADVRDVAKAHRLAYENPKSAGQRYFITSGNFGYQDVADILRKNPKIADKVPVGKPGTGVGVPVFKVDNSKARNELGLKFTDLETTISDTAEQFLVLEGKA